MLLAAVPAADMAAPHPKSSGFREVPHTDLVQIVCGGSAVRHVLTGEQVQLWDNESHAKVAYGGDLPRAFVVTNRRSTWINDLFEWSAWETAEGVRFFWSAQGGSVWERHWTCSFGRSSGSEEDVLCSVREAQWFHAAQHWDDLNAYISRQDSAGIVRDLSCLDMFSASRRIERAFQSAGKTATAVDIQLSRALDITSRGGFYALLDHVLHIQPSGLVFAGPPCALFVFMSSSVHRRSASNLLGDTRVYKVRLSNLVVHNLCVLLRIATQREAFWVIEQPSSSSAERITTWMGQLGHPMAKCTHLCGTLPTMAWLARSRPAGRSSGSATDTAGQELRFYSKGEGEVTGGRDLQLSAAYTEAFSQAVLHAWLSALGLDKRKRRGLDQ